MSGFIRRFGFFPGVEVITQIEGAVVIDQPPPSAIQGVGTGVVGIVGEFSDMTFAVQVDGSGNVSSKPQPVEILSAKDLTDKLGGWDETIGEFGVSGGNGFAALRNKRFSRLVAVPVNLASSKGIRVFRQLPTNASATSATPIVPMQAGSVVAGREFKSGANRVRVAARVDFTSDLHYDSGIDGAVTAAGAPAATQSFSSAGGDFVNKGVRAGDLLVLGVIGGALGLGSNAATYRVNAVTSATALVLEKLDGSSFDWVTTVAMPWRLHAGVAGDSASPGFAITAAGGATIPARPLDITVVGSTALIPSVVPAAPTATSWDPLSGLGAVTSPGTPAGDLVYTAAVQAPNAVSSASFDALYQACLQALLADAYPARDVVIAWCARTSATIRSLLKTHALTASEQSGRVAVVSPEISQFTESTVVGDASPGVGATRDERVFYEWPGALNFVPEAVGFLVKTALGGTTADGMLDDRCDGWLASVLSNLPPEQNPGQSGEPIATVMSPIQGFQRGVGPFALADYILFKQRGIAALRLDQDAGPIFQSGITSSLTSGQKNISRRRMADFIQDSLARGMNKFAKKLMTPALKDDVVVEVQSFLEGLLSPNNPPAQRIGAFSLDSKSGNTPDLEARGIFVVISRVRTLASADDIVAQTEIGENVNVTVA